MRALWNGLTIFLVLNLLALMGGLGWLYKEGRIDRERVEKVVAVFELTIDQEQQQEELAQTLAVAANEQAKRTQWLETVKSGARTVEGRLNDDEQNQEISLIQGQRKQKDEEALLRSMRNYQKIIEDQKKALIAQRKDFEQLLSDEAKRRESEGFKQAVAMHEQGKADQVKRVFLDLIQQGQTDQVIEYLSAMKTRKAVAIIKKFQTDDEIKHATNLIEGLRKRGKQLLLDNAQAVGASNAS